MCKKYPYELNASAPKYIATLPRQCTTRKNSKKMADRLSETVASRENMVSRMAFPKARWVLHKAEPKFISESEPISLEFLVSIVDEALDFRCWWGADMMDFVHKQNMQNQVWVWIPAGETQIQACELQIQLGNLISRLGSSKSRWGTPNASLGAPNPAGKLKSKLGSSKSSLGSSNPSLGVPKSSWGSSNPMLGGPNQLGKLKSKVGKAAMPPQGLCSNCSKRSFSLTKWVLGMYKYNVLGHLSY